MGGCCRLGRYNRLWIRKVYAGEEMIVHTGLSLKFLRVVEPGNIDHERVHLEATKDCDVSFYILIATVAMSAERIYVGARPAYWFEPEEVKAGDHVIVYTKAGRYSKQPRRDGHFNHFFYWARN